MKIDKATRVAVGAPIVAGFLGAVTAIILAAKHFGLVDALFWTFEGSMVLLTSYFVGSLILDHRANRR